MKKLAALLILFLCVAFDVNAQILSPSNFLGYELGTHFTPHESVINYFNGVARQSKNVKLINYGKTYEGRDLIIAVISSEENINNLETIRQNNLSLTGLLPNKNVKLNKQPAILWLSYGVHGNEPSSTETAMKMLYDLVSAKNNDIKQWLENTVVLIDPCLNPDGRERFVTDFNSVVGTQPNPDPDAREHADIWPTGRGNHYYFDLNRDWAWQTQIESQQRIALYNQWMPQVHVDFHEQNYNEPYYFAPAAEPMHQNITAWQRNFQIVVGKNNARYFDERGWKYFTKEKFDLLYPSYGDTYPLYNGAIGMTYEQGGIKAGLSVITNDGDTLTLKNRIEHHFISGISTLEVISQNKLKLLEEFKKYFQQVMYSAPGEYRTFVVKAENISRLRKLADLLSRNQIAFAFGSNQTAKGFNYETKQQELFKIERNDLIVNLQQPKAVLANVLFEPETKITDSNTYDITAWALPYIYGLKAYASKENIKGTFTFIDEPSLSVPLKNKGNYARGGFRTDKNGEAFFSGDESYKEPNKMVKPYAWAFTWGSKESIQMLKALHQAKIKVRIADEPFTTGGIVYERSTLLVYRAENEKYIPNLYNRVSALAENNNVKLYQILNSYVEKGKDFGSSFYRVLPEPKIAALSGSDVSAQGLGEVWHFFEQELNYPLHIIETKDFFSIDINKYNTLICAEGTYNKCVNDNLTAWLSKGGKLVLIGDAIASVIDKKDFEIKKKEPSRPEQAKAMVYGSRDKDDLDYAISGAIFKTSLETTHPIAYGIGKNYYSLKTDGQGYAKLKSGYNISIIKENGLMEGIVGKKVALNLNGSLVVGVQKYNKGLVVYLVDNPLFRAFLEEGKDLVFNVLFVLQ